MSSRIFNSIRNTSYALISQVTISILTFVTRTFFIQTLGNTYLGLSGLFGDILTLLSLAELGVGTAIIYSMYKPVAEGDKKKVSALVNLYGKIYRYIGIFITIIGLCITPFLSIFISNMPDITNIKIIYILYLLNTSLSYIFIYKKSILIATQNFHIVSIIQTIITIFQNTIQILILVIFKNFIAYLIVQIVFSFLNNVCISIYVDKKHLYLKTYKNEKVDQFTKKEILKNVASMFLSKVSSAIVTSTDNILISKFVSTITLGYYSNYMLFVNLVRQIFSKIFEAITGSVGNLVSIESKEKSHEVFEKIFFINFWLIGFCSITLFVLINPFITIWIGESYTLSVGIVLFICINMYMRFIRNTALIFIDTYGLFTNIKWKCIAEAIINLVASIIYLKILDLGIVGVLLGTFTSNILTNFWYEPYIIYKNKFNKKLNLYFIKFLKYSVVTMITGYISFNICSIRFFENNITEFIVDFIQCIIITNVLYLAFFFKSKEFIYISDKILKTDKFNIKIRKYREIKKQI